MRGIPNLRVIESDVFFFRGGLARRRITWPHCMAVEVAKRKKKGSGSREMSRRVTGLGGDNTKPRGP